MAYMQTFGAIPSKYDIRDYVANLTTPVDLPEEFELEVCAVKNQGSVGSCVAHAISEVVEYFNKIQEGSYVKMSTGYIYGNRHGLGYTGSGMYVTEALNNTVKFGTVPNSLFNVNVEVPDAITQFNEKSFELAPDAIPNRFSSYYRLSSTEAIKVNLIQNGPVVFTVPWYSDFRVINGILTHDPEATKISGYHCMIIYGWNKNGWKFQNSWGPNWGDGGRAILPFDFKITEAYGVIDKISSKGNEEIIKKLEAENKEYLNRIEELNLTLNSLNKAYNDKLKQLNEAEALLEKLKESLEEDQIGIQQLQQSKEALEKHIQKLTDSYNELKASYDENLIEL